MPLIRKRKRGEDEDSDPAPKKGKKVFEVYTSIGYQNDSCHSIFSSIPYAVEDMQDLVSRELVSFLNTSGGILCFGVRGSGMVYGVNINRKEEDALKCAIDEVVKKIHPMVKPGMYRVTFTPVVDHRGRDTKSYVLEIRMQKGDQFQLYETGVLETKGRRIESRVFVRNGSTVSTPLTPCQIKTHTCKLLKEKLSHQADLADKLSATSSTIRPPAVVEKRVDVKQDTTTPPTTVLKVKHDTALKEVNSGKSKKAHKGKTVETDSDECPLPAVEPKGIKKAVSSAIARVKRVFIRKKPPLPASESNMHTSTSAPASTVQAHHSYSSHSSTHPLTRAYPSTTQQPNIYPPPMYVPPPPVYDAQCSNEWAAYHRYTGPYTHHQRQYARNHYERGFSYGEY